MFCLLYLIILYIESIPADIELRCYNTLRKIAIAHAPPLSTLNHQGDADTPNEWHYGATGCGKSRGIRDRYPAGQLYCKDASNAWMEQFNGEPNMLIEDVDKYHVKLGYQIKIWADRYPFIGNVKGSSVSMRPEKVLVTSNYLPEDIWSDDATVLPIYRRFAMHKYLEDGTIVITKPGDDNHKPMPRTAFVFPVNNSQ